MLLEMHCHTAEHSPCSHVSAARLLGQIYRKGLQGAIITDHHYLWPEGELRALRKATGTPGYFIVLSGQEVATPEMGDVLVYGASETIPKGTPLADMAAKFPQAAFVLAHPYRKGARPADELLLNPLLSGIEIFSSNHSVTENTRALRDWHRLRFIAMAGTDTHGESYAGLYPTIFDHPVESILELAGEVKHGRCRPFLKEIPKAGANARVDEITIGTKGDDETRERIIVRRFQGDGKWLSAERSFYIMEEFARHGFDRGKYRVPRMLEEDKENMLLIEQGLRGNSLFEKVTRSDIKDARSFVRLSAEWLARLHQLGLQITPSAEYIEKEPARLARYLERFEEAGHPHVRRAREIAEAVERAEIAIFGDHSGQLVQGHGDYHLKNI
jgi:hypothetical protein